MEESGIETLDLSKRGLKKIEKASKEESNSVINLILDQNDLQRLENIDTYTRVENLSICNNFLFRMHHGISQLTNIRILSLNNNEIIQIEGLKDLLFLKVLKLSGNKIKSIEHLNHNIHLEQLDLSNNQISYFADISYLKSLKHLNVERNRVIDLRQCDRYLPPSIEHLCLAHNNIQDLNEISHLVNLKNLEKFSILGNPCVTKLGFEYRPFVLNWIMSVKVLDGFPVSGMENLTAEWLYSQGKGRSFNPGQHKELCEYLTKACPLTNDASDTEEQRKLRLILSKAELHQQQLKDQTNNPVKQKLQSPRMQSRIASRHMGRSPDRLSSSYHSAITKCSSPSSQMSMSCSGDINVHSGVSQAMSQSFDSPGLMYSMSKKQGDGDKERSSAQSQTPKPSNHSLEAASKMVPVPESLMSPDYQDPIYDMQRNVKHIPNSTSNHSSQSSNSSTVEEKRPSLTKNIRNSPKQIRSAMSSPKLKSKTERKGSLTRIIKDEKLNDTPKKIECMNGVTKTPPNTDRSSDDSERIAPEKLETIKVASNQRRQRKMSAEAMAAVTIQKMWRGYRSRNLNKDTLRILHAIQAARTRQHILRLTCDMEATKAAFESERKIQHLQMQAINALWKKVSLIQPTEVQKHNNCESEERSEVLRQLTDTCSNLQAQVVELQSSMQQILRAVSSMKNDAAPVSTQTEVTAVNTPQEERYNWLKRPQSLPITTTSVPARPTLTTLNIVEDDLIDKCSEIENDFDANSESINEEKSVTEVHSILSDNEPLTDTVEKHRELLID